MFVICDTSDSNIWWHLFIYHTHLHVTLKFMKDGIFERRRMTSEFSHPEGYESGSNTNPALYTAFTMTSKDVLSQPLTLWQSSCVADHFGLQLENLEELHSVLINLF